MVNSGFLIEKKPYRGQRVMILGAAGFMGRWIGRYLTSQGAELFLIVRDLELARQVFVEYGVSGEIIVQNLFHLPAAASTIKMVQPSIVFNLAGYGVDPNERDEASARIINSELPGFLCQEMAEINSSNWRGQRLVHAGSAMEYGEAKGNLVETTTPMPKTLYGISKLKGTRELSELSRKLSVRCLTARLFTVYGPGELPGRLLPSLLQSARSGINIQLTSGLQKRDFTFVEDVAEGLLRLGLIETSAGDVVNLASGKLTTVREFVETAASVLNIPSTNLQFGTLPSRSEEMDHEPVSVCHLNDIIHWLPQTGIAEGIRKTSEFLTPKSGEN